jgi:hypothetical protein
MCVGACAYVCRGGGFFKCMCMHACAFVIAGGDNVCMQGGRCELLDLFTPPDSCVCVCLPLCPTAST